jgi:hypothetical protein
MADRYQDRAYGAGQGRSGDQYGSDRGEGDPLAELARLIGKTDPFGKAGAPGQPRPVAPRQEPRQPDIRQRDPRQPDIRQQEVRPQDLRPQDPRPQDLRQDYYAEQDYVQPAPEAEQPGPAGPPAWMQRANIRREPPREPAREFQREVPPREMPRALPPEPEPEADDYLSAVHPLHRYAPPPQPQAPPPQPDHYYDEQPAYEPQAYQPQAYQQQGYQQEHAYQRDPQEAYREAEQDLDPSRYDDALYGQIETGAQDFQRDPAYPDDPYAYQSEYDEELEEPQRRRGLPFKVGAVLALGVFGVAAAYGYHSYFGTTRSGDIPIIKADNSPTKVVPQQSDASAKLPDRMVTGDGAEKIVPREEQPVDINSRSVGPRVVFPNLNQNANPPAAASVAPTAMPPAAPPGAGPTVVANNGTLPNGEPRKIRTFSVKSDQPDQSATPVTQPPAAASPPPAPAARNARMAKGSPTQANASASGPMSLSPQGQPVDTGTQVASTSPTQIAPSAAPAAAAGGYLVSITSQPSEADSQAAFRAMQDKYPSVLGSQSPVIARATTKSGATTYRAGVSFPTHDEAAKFCKSYETVGGQCWVVKN